MVLGCRCLGSVAWGVGFAKVMIRKAGLWGPVYRTSMGAMAPLGAARALNPALNPKPFCLKP